MKKILTFIMAILLSISMFSQNVDNYGIATHSIDATIADGSGEAFVGIFVDMMAAVVKAVFGQGSQSEITGWTPFISASYMYHFNDSRWSIGPEVGYWHMGIRDKETLDMMEMSTVTLACRGRFYYKPNGICKLYGNLDAGVGGFISSDFSVFPAVQLNPIGMRLGNERIGFITELGAGYKGILQLGVEVSL